MDGYIFEGLRVIDCANFIAGPAAATVLADFGAEVVKVEPPAGDPYRLLAAGVGTPKGPRNYAWDLDSRHKKSVVLDLAGTAGQQALRRLVAGADVFLTNYPLDVRERLRLRHADLAPLNERLIYASLTGFGESGPDAHRTAFDSTAWWARSGLQDTVRASGSNVPARSVPGMGDHPTAMALYAAIVTALYRRERTGRGGEVGTSLLANGAWSNGILLQAALDGASFAERRPREHGWNALATLYECADGRWLLLALVRQEKEWPRLLRAIARPDLGEDARFATADARRDNASALIGELDRVFAAAPQAHWRERLAAAGVTFGDMAGIAEAAADPQMRAAGAVIDDVDGRPAVANPLRIAGARVRVPTRGPELGEHSDEVLGALAAAEETTDAA